MQQLREVEQANEDNFGSDSYTEDQHGNKEHDSHKIFRNFLMVVDTISLYI